MKRLTKLENDLEDEVYWRRTCAQADDVMRRVRSGSPPDLDSLPDELMTLLAYGAHPFEDRWLTFPECARVESWYDNLPADAQRAWDQPERMEDLADLARAHGHPFAPAGNAG